MGEAAHEEAGRQARELGLWLPLPGLRDMRPGLGPGPGAQAHARAGDGLPQRAPDPHTQQRGGEERTDPRLHGPGVFDPEAAHQEAATGIRRGRGNTWADAAGRQRPPLAPEQCPRQGLRPDPRECRSCEDRGPKRPPEPRKPDPGESPRLRQGESLGLQGDAGNPLVVPARDGGFLRFLPEASATTR